MEAGLLSLDLLPDLYSQYLKRDVDNKMFPFQKKSRVQVDTPSHLQEVENYLLADKTLDIKPTYMGIDCNLFSKEALVRIVASAMLDTNRERKYHEQSLSLFSR